MPEISALMSVYNGESYITETIDSILNQSFKDFELIIIDDGSTDKTFDRLTQYQDPRIKIYRFKDNRGVGAALKFGLSKTTGRYFVKVDADDINRVDRFEIQYHFLENHPAIGLVQSFISYFPNDKVTERSTRYINMKKMYEEQTKTLLSTNDFSEKLYWYCCVIHASVMGRMELIKKISYDETMRNGEDYKLFYELNKIGVKICTIPEVLVMVRVSSSSTSVINQTSFVETIYQIKKNELTLFLRDHSYSYYIWGSGGYGQNFLDKLLEDKDKIVGFIDSNVGSHGSFVMNKQIYSPQLLRIDKHKVIVASTPGRFEITEELRKKGFHFMKNFFVF